jgi:6-phosphogluconolactonase
MTLRLLAAATLLAPAMLAQYAAYFGTYTKLGKSQGIYASRFDTNTGKFTAPTLAVETPSPSFLAVHPNGRFLYAVNEIGGEGTVSAFAIDPGPGALKLLNRVSARGNGPCHLALDRTGKVLYAANYGSGSIAAWPVKADGSLADSSAFDQHSGSSADRQRQLGPHAHGTFVSADNRFVLTPDLGLDKIFVYHVDPANGTLPPHDPPFFRTAPGSGPRHLAFHPSGKFVYVLTEMGIAVVAFRWDEHRGTAEQIQSVSAFPAGPGMSGAEIEVHPNGRLLFASVRGDNSIAAFRVDPANGKLTAAGRTPTEGKTPRGFAIAPGGKFLVVGNQDSDTVVEFRIDEETGALTKTGEPLQIGSPVSIVFVR